MGGKFQAKVLRVGSQVALFPSSVSRFVVLLTFVACIHVHFFKIPVSKLKYVFHADFVCL